MTTEPISISAKQREQYVEEGYFILEHVVPDDLVRDLQRECDRYVEEMNQEMNREGTDTLGITHRNSRYFIANRWKDSDILKRAVFNDTMAQICRATLGPDALLFHEQFVVKCPGGGMKFSWHQDSGYIDHHHRPYLSCWCALDDMSEENGTVRVLPFSRSGVRERIEHTVEEGSNDRIGYFGSDTGIPVIVPAGGAAIFSSVTFHSSGQNTSNGPRRVYLAQYSAEPIMTEDGQRPWNNVEPFLADGTRVDRFTELQPD